MPNNINDLQIAWETAGNKVTDLQDKKQQMATELVADPSKYSDEEIKKISDDLKAAKTARDFAKSALDDAKEAAKTEDKTVNKTVNILPEKDEKNKFVDTFKDMLRHPSKYMDMVTSSPSDDSAAGLTIPVDAQTHINELMRQYASLQPLVSIESVGTLTGTRNIEKFGSITPATLLTDQNAEIPEGDYPSLKNISYKIGDYGDLFYAPNSLLQDSAENILGWLETHIARKSVVTRNNAILTKLPTTQKKATITKFDDLFDAEYQLDAALMNSATILTNKSGFLTLRKVKNAMGDYLIKPDPTQDSKSYLFDGKNVVWVEDTWLPDNTDSNGKYVSHPFYIGNFQEFLRIFDRQQMVIATSTQTDQAFKRNQTAIRSIERFDVEVIDDEALVAGSFDTIADQTANFAASSTTAG
jgi:HK97 family phage major capsid protein